MLRLVMKARTAPRGFASLLVCALCATAACGAEEPERPAAAVEVRSSKLAIQRRADGLEQIDLRSRPQHVTVARAAGDAGVARSCAHGEQGEP